MAKLPDKSVQEEFQWIVTDARVRPRLPKWQRSIAVGTDGTLYVPAVYAGNEQRVALCASFDSEPLLLDSHHVYLRLDWMRKEYPAIQELLDTVEQKIREHIDSQD